MYIYIFKNRDMTLKQEIMICYHDMNKTSSAGW